MEALVVLLAEFLTAFLVPALILAVEVAALLLTLVLDLVLWLCFGKPRIASPSKGAPGAPRRGWQDTLQNWAAAASRIRKPALIGLGLTISALALANTVFFEPTVRLILAMVGQRTGTELAFKSVSGNLFTGRFAFQDISARRVSDTRSSFDLKARDFGADLDPLTLLDPPIVFDSLSVNTVTGTFRQPEKPRRAAGKNGGSGERIKAKRKFRIENLTMSDVSVGLSRGESAPAAILLKSVTSTPFRSNFAVFDTLFRSNVSGQIDGHDISISTQRTDSGRTTQWRMPDLPAGSVSRFVTKPPIGWMREGVLNISVDDRWKRGNQTEIDMDWSIRMQGVRAEVSEGAGAMERMIAVPIISYINGRDGNVDLRFKLVMDESQFENMTSLDVGALWEALLRSMASSIATSTGEDTQDARQAVDQAVEGFKSFLGKRRKPPAGE
jgi:hypothetical protein